MCVFVVKIRHLQCQQLPESSQQSHNSTIYTGGKTTYIYIFEVGWIKSFSVLYVTASVCCLVCIDISFRKQVLNVFI